MAEPMKDQFQQYYAKDRQAWRAWLEEHHANTPGVCLICYKQQSGKPCVSYKESVEEALCFGWIDSRINAIDDERNMAFSSSIKKQLLWWIASAKRPETRTKRIEQVVSTAEEKRNPLNYIAKRK